MSHMWRKSVAAQHAICAGGGGEGRGAQPYKDPKFTRKDPRQQGHDSPNTGDNPVCGSNVPKEVAKEVLDKVRENHVSSHTR